MSTLQVVEEVLRERRQSLTVREIVAAAGARLTSRSKTPDTVVARDLAMDIKRNPESTKFSRIAPGQYCLREHIHAGVVTAPPVAATVVAPPSVPAAAALDNVPQSIATTPAPEVSMVAAAPPQRASTQPPVPLVNEGSL